MQPSTINKSASPLAWRGPESPKGFFKLLRADYSYFHRAFGKWSREAGFEVRWVRKRANHDVWNLYLLCGSVPHGCETDTARQVISETLNRCGVKYPKKEIEVSVIGNRVGAAFIFQSGAPGTLRFRKSREFWCAEEWP